MSAHFQNLALLSSNRILELHVLPTEKCNFRCTYCYEDFAIGRMKPAVVTALKHFIASRVAGLDILSISWFGGEPLLARDIVLDVSRYARDVCGETNCHFAGAATTNGWCLEPTLATQLLNAGVRTYQVTLDGPEPVHDRSRKMQNGGASFARIWRNLTWLRNSDLDFSVMLRLHIAPDTLDQVLAWLPELKRELLDDPRFSILVKPIEHLGGPNDSAVAVYKTDHDREIAAGAVYTALGLSGPPRDDLFAVVCYAARPNAWVVRADGRLGKCTVALTSPRNTVGQLNLDGTLAIDHARLRPWFKPLETLDPAMLACPVAYLDAPV